MKLSLLAASLLSLPALLACNNALAQSYQSFSSISYFKTDAGSYKSDDINLNSTYFFDPRLALGPLNEFDYINKINNLSANYHHDSSESFYEFNGNSNDYESKSNSFAVSGEVIVGQFLIAGGYSHIKSDSKAVIFSDDSSNSYNMSLGYLITDDFLLKANVNKFDDSDEFYSFDARYNLQLNKTDYVGFNYDTDEDFDFHTLSTKYFTKLSSDNYLVLSGSYTYDSRDNEEGYIFSDLSHWHIGSSYYFNQHTSVFASYGKHDYYSVGANHFFTNNFSLRAQYNSAATSKNDFDGYSVSFVAQF